MEKGKYDEMYRKACQKDPKLGEKLRKRIALIDEFYPDGVITGLHATHKKLGEALTEIAKQLDCKNALELLQTLGYTAEVSLGGRPSTSRDGFINELRRRYPNGSTCSKMSALMAENPDIAGQFSTMKNIAQAQFGMSLGDYLKSIGILCEKPAPAAKPVKEPKPPKEPKESKTTPARKEAEPSKPAGRAVRAVSEPNNTPKLSGPKHEPKSIMIETRKHELSAAVGTGKTICWGRYDQGTDPTDAVKPLEWQVLTQEGDRMLLVSKYALAVKECNLEMTSVPWEECTIRRWLNNGFLNYAFTAAEQAEMVPANGRDRVFLLSSEEAETYLPGKYASQYTLTPYVLSAFEDVEEDTEDDEEADGDQCEFWLRYDGVADHAPYMALNGEVKTDKVNSLLGICPAMWLKADAVAPAAENPVPPITLMQRDPSLTMEKLAAGCTAGSTVRFGRYEQKEGDVNGKQPIEWTVLARENDRALLISKYALAGMEYRAGYLKTKNRTWETSTLRGWLNDQFIRTAFYKGEQPAILTTTVKAEENPDFYADVGEDTQDRVFLLSFTEADVYFANDDARCCTMNGAQAKKHPYGEVKRVHWWLRTPGSSELNSTFVADNGGLISDGNYTRHGYGVRPAMWVDLKACLEEAHRMPSKSEQLNDAIAIGGIVTYGKCKQGSKKDAPLYPAEWLVLTKDEQRALLISKHSVANNIFSSSDEGIWSNSSIRTWLNGTFLKDTFTAQEQAAIQITTVDPEENPDYDGSYYRGGDTKDKVFLLSLSEAEKYFPNNAARRCEVPAKGARSRYVSWWLRTAGSDYNYASRVDKEGFVDSQGEEAYLTNGIRPAFWLDLGAVPEGTLLICEKGASNALPESSLEGLRLNYAEGNSVKFGHYIQDDYYGKKKEPIEWWVCCARGDQVLLVSKHALDAKPYHDTNADITWEKCSLRSWLNDEFLHTAFSETEQDAIICTENKTNESGTEAVVTRDRVFVLSPFEAMSHLPKETMMRCRRTSYAEHQGAWVDHDYIDVLVWLRGRGMLASTAAYMDSLGRIESQGASVDYDSFGVRPALWIDLKKLSFS